MDPISILAAVLKYIGVKDLAKWSVRLVFVAVFIGGGFALMGLLLFPPTRDATENFLASVIVWAGVFIGISFVVWLLWKLVRRSRRPQAAPQPVERTIDGKTVPDKLAVAALAVPVQSAGIYDVLRGLPDYGKTLLKLDAREFEYRPEEPVRTPEPEPEPVRQAPPLKAVPWLRVARVNAMIWLRTLPRWAMAAGAAALVAAVVGGMVLTQQARIHDQQRAERENRERISAFFNTLDSSPSVKAESTPAPAPAENPPAQDKQQQFVDAWAKAVAPSSPAATVQAAGGLWTATDNGHGVNWQEADEYCSGLTLAGRRWRLPTAQELSAAWDEKKAPSSRNPGYVELGGGFQVGETGMFPMLWSADSGGSNARALYASARSNMRLEANIGTFRATREKTVKPEAREFIPTVRCA